MVTDTIEPMVLEDAERKQLAIGWWRRLGRRGSTWSGWMVC